MKNTMTVSAALGISLLMLSPIAFAQKPERDPIAEHLFPPELIMSNQNAIGLDDEQKNAIRAEGAACTGALQRSPVAAP